MITLDPKSALARSNPVFCCDDVGPTAYVFRALSHPSRLRLIQCLARGPHSKRALQSELATGDAYEHLKVLHAAGIVYPSGIGRNIKWLLVPDVLDTIAGLLTEAAGSTAAPSSAVCDNLRDNET